MSIARYSRCFVTLQPNTFLWVGIPKSEFLANISHQTRTWQNRMLTSVARLPAFRWHWRQAGLCCVAWLGIIACGGGAAARPPGPAPQLSSYQTYSSAHFDFDYSPHDAATVPQVAAALEAEWQKIQTDLETGGMPRVRVMLHATRAELEFAVWSTVGAVPSWATGVVTSSARIDMMYLTNSPHGSYATMLRTLVHEFAHCVSLHINPRFGNRPRWLWESIAVYEAAQAVNPATVDYMRMGQPPSMTELNDLNNTRVYTVGYTIGEFIVARWGRDALHTLIVNHGDLSSLSVTEAEFMAAWYQFTRTRYGY